MSMVDGRKQLFNDAGRDIKPDLMTSCCSCIIGGKAFDVDKVIPPSDLK